MSTDQQTFPKVAEIATASLALTIVGGITMASYAPRRPPLTLPVILLIASGGLLVTSVLLLTRVKDFSWGTFVKVDRWAFLAYLISAGMIEFAFVKDHTRGAPLLVLTLMLVIFATSVPLIIAFTAAKYQSRK
jgi:hypothetical protein